jgi:hypothetical protein
MYKIQFMQRNVHSCITQSKCTKKDVRRYKETMYNRKTHGVGNWREQADVPKTRLVIEEEDASSIFQHEARHRHNAELSPTHLA